ncbi:FKBP-type peptidyl-prolyl cis-trans isomerase [Gynuella sunshinyii]|uniref:Peptidyl-prolyl cis-trans isomerase n=1 Tax=Gynuella sunshinyii YC6258 TaxID=1445510 RepID=A0A0C5W479_9GAMM|nr:FKBP-type peptidyl-prolyl cis-trans isomerases 2 [Gynuella sunshinyii YC6258]
MKVGPNTRVTLHFAIRLPDGAEVDSNFGGKPAEFNVGDGNLLPGFEESLFGMTAGERRCMSIPPEKGFGMPNPQNLQQFQRSQFDEQMEIRPGLVISFSDAANSELPGVVKEVNEDSVVVDFNHPLSGKTLEFDVEILRVCESGQ